MTERGPGLTFSVDGETIFFTSCAVESRLILQNAASPTVRPIGGRLACIRDNAIWMAEASGN